MYGIKLLLFTLKCILRTHMRNHSGDRPSICKVCNKSYVQVYHFKVCNTRVSVLICLITLKKPQKFARIKWHKLIHREAWKQAGKRTNRRWHNCDACNKSQPCPHNGLTLTLNWFHFTTFYIYCL